MVCLSLGFVCSCLAGIVAELGRCGKQNLGLKNTIDVFGEEFRKAIMSYYNGR
jgi:hypothetical protein